MCWIFGAFSKYSIDLYNDRTMEKKFSHYVILNESKVTEEEIATQFETLTGSEGIIHDNLIISFINHWKLY